MGSKLVTIAALSLTVKGIAQDGGATVTVHWDQVTGVSKTTVSIHNCVEPPMRRGSPIHDQLFKALRDMKADYARFQTWHPYPKLAVAELDPPKDGKTSWDFSLMDPLVADFFEASEGRPVMLNLSTIPEWMFKTDKPVSYPADPDEIARHYSFGNTLRDPTLAEVAGYFKRLVGWYTKGGFNDEYGKWHESGHHYKVAYFEVLNEVDFPSEHGLSPKQYTDIYDAVVSELRKLDPEMKFSGLALAGRTTEQPDYFEYFLNPRNHKPGIPLDMISYHFYATPARDETNEVQQRSFFYMADKFLIAVRYIQAIRNRLSPHTLIYLNEVGSFTADRMNLDIPLSYWTLSGSMFAYLFAHFAEIGVDLVAGSELIDYPGQPVGATLVDWRTGKPNARYWVLKLLRDNFGPGDKLVNTEMGRGQMDPAGPGGAQYALVRGFISPAGDRKILLVNERDRKIRISIRGITGAQVHYVDQSTGFEHPASAELAEDAIELKPQAVAVARLSK